MPILSDFQHKSLIALCFTAIYIAADALSFIHPHWTTQHHTMESTCGYPSVVFHVDGVARDSLGLPNAFSF